LLFEDEFITLSSTYIEQLINFWLKYKRENTIKEINKLINTILTYAIDDIKTETDDYYLNNIKQTNELQNICTFFRTIFNDKKYIGNSKKQEDKFKTLIKWTLKSFQEKVKDLKNNRKIK
jgi:hypothetical protein